MSGSRKKSSLWSKGPPKNSRHDSAITSNRGPFRHKTPAQRGFFCWHQAAIWTLGVACCIMINIVNSGCCRTGQGMSSGMNGNRQDNLLAGELCRARADRVGDDDNLPFYLAPAATAAAVLLVHGFSATPWEMRPLAEDLMTRGFACLAVRLPGHG